jgi:hypothetical protein
VDEFIVEAGVRLAEVAGRNTASIILDRVRLARERKASVEVVNDLVGIINELIDDKNELLQVANAYKEALSERLLSDADIAYIDEHLIPMLGEVVSQEQLAAMRPILSANSVRIAQLIGFSFKEGVGAPLTRVAASHIDKLAAPTVGSGWYSTPERQVAAEIACFISGDRKRAAGSKVAASFPLRPRARHGATRFEGQAGRTFPPSA